ncbi:MAG: Flavodoxin/nitric oxide synthase [candidate division WS6 bacterium GW2011_GWE1_34_7]|uniref:Flavodoxin/nitric oxide synthase n=1 Tax=candidate division WS6 bacterium GW2011_GWE1_34_7 TaxID=1619093 RepID=A0A0G0EDI5_9BACT|nr:MAG: Flavodoxin/nitric oxide synthase [candidate division WS6 bacterium GW2011_GWE1_34_7]
MRTLIIYDSLHGNTKEIAEAIYNGIAQPDTKILPVEKAITDDLKDIKLLIVGSPTHGGTAKPTLLDFLKRIQKDSLVGIKIATFDTRFLEEKQKVALRLLMKTIGYAAPKIAKILESKGGELIVKPEGFFVKKAEGPLLNGEIQRAKEWGKSVYNNIS